MVNLGASSGETFLFGYLLLALVFIVFLVASYRYDIKQVILVDSFVCSIVAIMLFSSGLLPVVAIGLPVTLLVFSVIIHYLTG